MVGCWLLVVIGHLSLVTIYSLHTPYTPRRDESRLYITPYTPRRDESRLYITPYTPHHPITPPPFSPHNNPNRINPRS